MVPLGTAAECDSGKMEGPPVNRSGVIGGRFNLFYLSWTDLGFPYTSDLFPDRATFS